MENMLDTSNPSAATLLGSP